MTGHHRYRVGDLDGRVLTLERPSRCSWQTRWHIRRGQWCRRSQIGCPGRVAAIERRDPLPPISPTARVMSGQGEWWRAVLVHPPESLRHPNDRSVLCLKFLQVALSALDNENRLREVRRIDDRELSAGWRGHENEDEGADE